MANFQTDIPAGTHPGFEPGLIVGVRFGVQQQEHIHVGARKQLAPAVAAHSGKTDACGQLHALAQRSQHCVDEISVTGEIATGDGTHAPGFGQRRTPRLELLAQVGNGKVVHAAWRTRSGTAGLPAETVSTS